MTYTLEGGSEIFDGNSEKGKLSISIMTESLSNEKALKIITAVRNILFEQTEIKKVS